MRPPRHAERILLHDERAIKTLQRRATARRGLSPRRPLSLKLDVALPRDRRLFDRDHLALHLSELGGRLLVAADEESRRPEDYDGRGGRDTVLGSLAILGARQCSRSR